jgi:hypothetical protein
MPGDARRQKLVYRESTRRTVCPVIERIYALAGTHEAECFLAESRIILRRDKRPEIGPLRADSLYVLLLPFLGGHFWYTVEPPVTVRTFYECRRSVQVNNDR